MAATVLQGTPSVLAITVTAADSLVEVGPATQRTAKPDHLFLLQRFKLGGPTL